MGRRFALAVLALGCATCGGDPDPGAVPEISGDLIATHTRVLSSDEYMGRGPGHPGGEMAAAYIAGRFEEYGLEAPGGSYYQTVPMIGTTPDASTVSLTFAGPGGTVAPRYLDDFVLSSGQPEAQRVEGEAELVFVGYGIDAPEADWNDFAGVDVAGKYILILVNDPPAPASEPDRFGGVAMTYYGRWTYKYEEAARQGALGALVVHETEPAGYPWSVVRGGFSGEQFSLPPDPGGPRPADLLGWVSLDLARAVLGVAGLDYDELKARAAERDFAAVPTGVTVRAAVDSEFRRVETANVVGLLPGTQRPDEYITVSAHYDHFGIGEPVDGDSIYNGAYDNASGTGLIIEMARALSTLDPGPARSVVFIATGAEEQGLLGAEWYVQSPLFPLERTVMELNFDQANLWGETTDVIVFGEERSELGRSVRPHAAHMGLTIVPDAEPQNGIFYRSDHFPFAKAGVPSLYMKHGRDYVGRPAGWGDEVLEDYNANHYHAPSDEFTESLVFDGAVQQALLGTMIVLDVASGDAWPNWHEGQEFKAARDAMHAGR